MKLHPGLEWHIFNILTSEDIDDFTDIKFLNKWYLNLLVYDQNIFGSSSKLLEIFGNFQKMFGNVRLAFGTILENLRKSLESGWKSSENRQKGCHQYVHVIMRTLHVS